MPNDVVRYLIAGPTRSGTTAVHLMLAGHPQVAALTGELAFERLASGIGGFTVRGYVTEAEQREGTLALFDAITGACRTSGTRALGAKTTVNSAAAAGRMCAALDAELPSVKLIVLLRRDLVAHYYSRADLRRTGKAHSWSHGRDGGRPARVDKRLLARSALVTTELYARLRRPNASDGYLEVDYETFARDNLATYRQLLDFLGLDYVEPTWHQSAKLHEHPDAIIPDYAALTAFVADLLARRQAGSLSSSYLRRLKLYARAHRLLRRSRPAR